MGLSSRLRILWTRSRTQQKGPTKMPYFARSKSKVKGMKVKGQKHDCAASRGRTSCHRRKHATLLAKLSNNADNTSLGVAWMKSKGSAFLQRSTNSDETFLKGSFAWSIAEPDRNILGQDVINLKRTTQWSVMKQRNVSHSTVGIVATVGFRSQAEGTQFLNVQQVTVSAAHKLC